MGDATGPAFPAQLPFDISALPKLTREQAGHLRLFHNIATTPDGEWPHMGTPDPEQAFLDAYRYQLATMVYASSVTHYYRLPAMKSLFKPLIRRLIHKMLLPHVWNYWYLTSQSGVRLDPDLKEMRKPWADPVVRENIMYSGHLLLMVSLYAMLFDDDEFEKEGALVFKWNPMFWGMGEEKFVYSTKSLQDAIIREMERGDWAGVCCEPNMVFVVCNQFPIIAMRYNDVRHGTKVADEVLEKYWPALQKKNMISPNSLFVDALLVRQSFPASSKSIGFTAWACAYMNSWNSSWVYSNFSKQVLGFVTTINDQTRIQAPKVGMEIRRLVSEENASPNSAETLQRARKAIFDNDKNKDSPNKNPSFQHQQPLYGYILEWLSELGKTAELNSLLSDLDANHKPIWENGALRYARDDRILNDDGEWTRMEPFSGNAGIAYARLNVKDGQKVMWERPWTGEVLKSRPYVCGVDLGMGVDCLRGAWNEECEAMVVTLKAMDGVRDVKVELSVENLKEGQWGVYQNGSLVDQASFDVAGSVRLQHAFSPGEEVDFVVMKQ